MEAPPTEDTTATTPALTRRRKRRERPGSCLNCGRVSEHDHDFCPVCGQEHRHHASLGEMFADLWDEFAHIDSKLLKSAAALLFRPGFLTREYVAGKRIRYIAPVKMYLVVSFFFFSALAWKSQDTLAKDVAKGQSAFSKKANDEKAQLHSSHSAGAKDSAHPAISIPDNDGEKPDGHSGKPGAKERDTFNIEVDKTVIPLGELPDTIEAYQSAQAHLPSNKRDGLGVQFAKYFMIRFKSGDSGSRASGLFEATSRMMFFLLPIYALLLKILYIRSRRLYVEHFVYALHLHTVAFLFLLTELLIPYLPVGLFLLAAFPVYYFISLKTVYEQRVFKTLFKACLLAILYLNVIIAAIVVTLLVSLAWQSGFLASLRSML